MAASTAGNIGMYRAATGTDRWRREGTPQFDMFAA